VTKVKDKQTEHHRISNHSRQTGRRTDKRTDGWTKLRLPHSASIAVSHGKNDWYMWCHELHSSHLINVATLPWEIQNAENTCEKQLQLLILTTK